MVFSEIISNFAALNSRFIRRSVANPLRNNAMGDVIDVRNGAGASWSLSGFGNDENEK